MPSSLRKITEKCTLFANTSEAKIWQKNSKGKSIDDTGLKEHGKNALCEDDEYNESAESNQDKHYAQNDRAAMFLDLAES